MGVELVMSSDAYTVGSQFMGPKWINDAPTAAVTAVSAVPAYLGLNPKKFLFSDIHVSTGSGSDTVGDGSHARPFQTIQRGVDAANENDQLILHSGTYTGLGNRGLRRTARGFKSRPTMQTARTPSLIANTLLMASSSTTTRTARAPPQAGLTPRTSL